MVVTSIPKRLKQVRKKANLSQEKLGIMAGIDEFSASARMNQYEVGKRVPDFLTLKRIGKVLGCPVAFFYVEEDIMADIIVSLSNLSKDKKKQVLEFIESLSRG